MARLHELTGQQLGEDADGAEVAAGIAYRSADVSRARLARRQERAMSAPPMAATAARNAPTARNIVGSTAGVLGEPGSSA